MSILKSKIRKPSEEAIPAFAIVGKTHASDVGILGSGVLVSPRYILTAAHVTDILASPSEYRVYSLHTGVRTVDEIRRIGQELALVKLEGAIPNGMKPVGLAPRPRKNDLLEAWGFGGGDTGLAQQIGCPVTSAGKVGRTPYFYLDRRVSLGRRDSGAPIIVRDAEGGYSVGGVYVGVRAAGGLRKFRRLVAALDVEPEASVLRSLINSSDRGPTGRLERVLLIPLDKQEKDDLSEEYGLGVGEQHCFEFEVDAQDDTRLVIAVNGTTQPLRSRLGLRTRVTGPDGKPHTRCFPGPFQSYSFPSYDDRRAATASNKGKWKIEIEADTEITYQIEVTLVDAT